MSGIGDKTAALFAARPRLLGGLFTMCLVLSSAGPTITGNGTGVF